MKKIEIVFVFASLFFAWGCGKSPSGPRGALPSDWLAVSEPRPGQVVQNTTSVLSVPPAETDKQVEAVFQAQSRGLDQFSRSESIGDSFRLLHGGPGGEPGEAPWHLNNFVASFGVSVEGIFGKLVSGGGAAAKGIWSRKGLRPEESEKKAHLALKSAGAHAVAWNTRAPRKTQLEPVVQMAMKSGKINNESNFRKNLDLVATRFDQMANLLEVGLPARNWQVSRFALMVEFDASGMVSPAVTVGTRFQLRLDWDRPPTPNGPLRESYVIRLASLTEEQARFVQLVNTIGSQIGAAEEEAGEMKELGFELNHIHLGLGLTIEGSIGVVSLGGSAEGLLYFSRPGEGETFQLQAMGSEADFSRQSIPVLKSDVPAFNNSDSVQVIDPVQFRKGMKRAINMGKYFAKAARTASTENWSLDEIETEFEIGLGGNFGVVTVEGEAHLAIEFGYEGDEE